MFAFVYSPYHLKLSRIFIIYCFEYLKKSLLKSSHPKEILAKFSYSKISRNWKFQTQKILLSSLSLEIRSTSPAGVLSMSDIICMGFCWIHCKTISPSKISLKHEMINWPKWTEWRRTACTMAKDFVPL